MKLSYLPLALFALLAFDAGAQGVDMIQKNYTETSIYLHSHNSYVKNNVSYFGHRSLLTEFTVSPGGLDLYLRSRRNRTIGMTVSLLGTAGSLYALFNRNNVNWQPFFWGSLLTGAVSVPLNMKATKQLNQAVWLRNRDALLTR